MRTIRRRLRAAFDRLVDMRAPYRVESDGSRVGILCTGREAVTLGGANHIGPRCSFKGGVGLGYGSTVGDGSYISGEVTIGRFSQIGPGVTIVDRDHPITHLSSSTSRTLLGGRQKQYQIVRPVVIGNDCWIGANVVILGGVSVGDGAVVGAGSVVNSDVAPFSVVAGSPAVVRRVRFGSDIAELITRLAWWDRSAEELDELADLFAIDSAAEPQRFRAALESAVENSAR